MKLDYFTLLSDEPIRLSNVGTLIPPKLINIRKDIGLDIYGVFLSLIKMTPKTYYEKIVDKKEYWDSMTKKQKSSITLYDIIMDDPNLTLQYISMFSFFFKEDVYIKEFTFILMNPDIEHKFVNNEIELQDGELVGIINADNITQVLSLIGQLCYIDDGKEDEKNLKFKNKKAKRLWEKMKKANENQKENSNDISYSIPNIMSSVASKDASTNIRTIWDWTVFQLFDQFTRLKLDKDQIISDTRVSVWGDEKNKYKNSLWFTNFYENK